MYYNIDINIINNFYVGIKSMILVLKTKKATNFKKKMSTN